MPWPMDAAVVLSWPTTFGLISLTARSVTKYWPLGRDAMRAHGYGHSLRALAALPFVAGLIPGLALLPTTRPDAMRCDAMPERGSAPPAHHHQHHIHTHSPSSPHRPFFPPALDWLRLEFLSPCSAPSAARCSRQQLTVNQETCPTRRTIASVAGASARARAPSREPLKYGRMSTNWCIGPL
ncbi:hypothetical protein B0T25DRAFT_258825 [Lasiosphaeria hispida]|uniref:Uncharacterized protein n=1 Tax=Lasiosphaeria hispida TaxID=260671 RepID=A0AAJ0HFW9_9PEZI|nr:hypothetical protein B0T25DRAFT_258825 [Lasiosphaeria hispida]